MAAPAWVQTTTGTPGGFVNTVTTSAFSTSPTSGHGILVIVNSEFSGNNISSVTDTAGNSYQNITGNYSGTSFNLEVWLAKNITGGSSFTVTVNDTANEVGNIIAMEISNLPTVGGPLDGMGFSITSNTVASPSVSTAAATTNGTDLVIGIFSESVNASVSYTVGSGFSNLTTVAGNTWSYALCAETKTVSSTGTQSASVGGQTTGQIGNMMVIALSNKQTSILRIPSQDTNTTGGNATITFPAATVSGNTILIAVNGGTAYATASGFTAIQEPIDAGADFLTLLYAESTGQSSVAVTSAGSGSQYYGFEYEGTLTPNSFDTSTGATSGTTASTTITTGAVTTSQTADLLFQVVGASATTMTPVGNGWANSKLLSGQTKLLCGQYLYGQAFSSFTEVFTSNNKIKSTITALFKANPGGQAGATNKGGIMMVM